LNTVILIASVVLIGVLLVSLVSIFNNVYGITVNNTDFTLEVLDNWAYREENPLVNAFASALGGSSPLTIIPIEFSETLINTNVSNEEQFRIRNEGAFSLIGVDATYPLGNTSLDLYTQASLNQSNVKIFSKENATIDGEPAVKIHRTARNNQTNMEVTEYYVIHEGKPYTLQYGADLKYYQKYLPQFEQMVKTFMFVK
jgi:hypothetical protein